MKGIISFERIIHLFICFSELTMGVIMSILIALIFLKFTAVKECKLHGFSNAYYANDIWYCTSNSSNGVSLDELNSNH